MAIIFRVFWNVLNYKGYDGGKSSHSITTPGLETNKSAENITNPIEQGKQN